MHAWLLLVAQTSTTSTSTLPAIEEDEPFGEISIGGVEIGFGGRLQSNVRFRPNSTGIGEWYDRRELEPGVSRNEHILKLKTNASFDRFSGVIDLDIVWLGFSPETDAFGDLSRREDIEEVRIEAHAAYLEAVDLLVDGLDLRLGQQIVSWGVGDQFNPTNTLNADDLEDRLLFGVQQANLMAKVDYSFEDYFTLSGVAVPVFRPGLLPSSAGLAIAAVDRIPHLDENLRYRLQTEAAVARQMGFPTRVSNVNVEIPKTNFKNMQYAARFSTTILEQDVALSYYFGRDDIPQPLRNTTRQTTTARCNPDNPADCIMGTLETEAIVGYPKIQVAGLNLAGEIPFLGSLGYRFELGVFFPREQSIRMFQEGVSIAGMTFDGEYDYRLGPGVVPLVLDDKPYAKWTLGIDYTFNEYFYVNVQWVHGLADETGAGDFISKGERVRKGSIAPGPNPLDDCLKPLTPEMATPGVCAVEIKRNNLGDYLVLGVDIRFLSGDGLLRLFGILDLSTYVEERFSMSQMKRVRTRHHPFSGDGLSLVLFPELSYNFGSGFELGVGALIFVGKAHTKFGDPAAGGNEIFTRGSFSF